MKPKEFSLDYLYKKGSDSRSQSYREPSAGLDKAFMLYSLPILKTLKESTDFRANLQDIAKVADINYKEIIQLLPKLKTFGYINVIKEDTITGNDIIEITEDGLKMLD